MNKSLVYLGLIGIASSAFGQLVCVGTEEQCRQTQDKLCTKLALVKNFELGKAKMLEGTVRDVTGAPFTAGYSVQLRNAASGRIFDSVPLDSQGRFRIAAIDPGVTRLVVAHLVDAKSEPFGFYEPTALRCGVEDKCTLDIVLKAMSTDIAEGLCPPK